MPMQIYRVGSRPSSKGPAEFFTGDVRIDPLFAPEEPARAGAALVTFEPGARSAWHHHPLGQHLVVTAGRGWTQCWEGPKKAIQAGDVVHCDCGQKALARCDRYHRDESYRDPGSLDGTAVTWLEKVSDEQYLADVEPD